MKIDLRKLETAFSRWSVPPFYIILKYPASCHWLSVNNFEWEIEPSFELGTLRSSLDSFTANKIILSRVVNSFIKFYTRRVCIKAEKKFVKTVIKIIKIIPSFLVACRKLDCAFL